jgi:putative Ca2+/H+ antiporter (TMEM165/GDT1 family)
VSGLLVAVVVFATITAVELPDNSGLASLVLGTRYRPGGVFAGTAAAFALHAVLAVTAGSLLALLPHTVVQIVVAVVFLAGAVLVLRAGAGDDDGARVRADAAGFWPVAATSFGVIAVAELGDLSDITMADLAARYHDPVAVGVGSVLGLWLVAGLAITGGRGLLRILPMRWISRLAALVMVVMAAITLSEAIR